MNETSVTQSFFPISILHSILRHKVVAALTFAIIVAASVGLLYVMPQSSSPKRKYSARGRESISLDPSATTSQTVQMMETRENGNEFDLRVT